MYPPISTSSSPHVSALPVNARDSKMDSFIRSKYDSRRWAMDGPPPSDPSSLDTQPSGAATTSTPNTTSTPPQRTVTPVHSNVNATASRSSFTNRQPQPHQLLSTSAANRAQHAAPKTAPEPQAQAPAQAPAPSASNDLFSLDFHTPSAQPTTTASPPPRKDVKQDILSLFSAAPAAAPVPSTAFGQFAQAPVQPGWPGAQVQAQASVTSMVGSNGVGMWGASSGWSPAQAVPAQNTLWGAPAAQPATQQQSLFTTSDVWGAPASGAGASGDMFRSTLPAMQKKDDAFGDIWGGFK